jgi:glucosamine--fructose-6-phosphate aminotransferase (isomerizing)
MRQEIGEIPEAVARLLRDGADEIVAAGTALRDKAPVAVVTIARGSSDHAAAFLKYATELTAAVPVASIGPSIASVYGRGMQLRQCAALAISQSGESPDIVAMAESARTSGALTLALTNSPGSPLALAADRSLDLRAGPERSVAATKTFVASVAAGLAVLAHWTADAPLKAALAALPDALSAALGCDWSAFAAALEDARSLFVLGRGPALAIAGEAALKFKETCGLHAEAYSAAEVLHGPARIVESGFPILALVPPDAAERSVLEVVAQLAGQGARCAVTSPEAGAATSLPAPRTGHALTDALALIVPFYLFVEQLARARGFDPDHPPHLHKVTRTL